MFYRILGQDRALATLTRALSDQRVGQAYLFFGPPGTGKFTTALYMGMAVNCMADEGERPCGVCPACKKFLELQHPDFLYLFPIPNMEIGDDGQIKQTKQLEEYTAYLRQKVEAPHRKFFFSGNTEIRLDQIRWLQHRINLTLSEGRKKVYIVEDADKLNQQAANAFLKTLEEPPEASLIILTSSRPDAILPTILSRCQKVGFYHLAEKHLTQILREHGVEDNLARHYARLGGGNAEKALELAESELSPARGLAEKFIRHAFTNNEEGLVDLLDELAATRSQALLDDFLSRLIAGAGDLVYLALGLNEYVLNAGEDFHHLAAAGKATPEQLAELPAALEDLKLANQGHANSQLVVLDAWRLWRQYIN